MVFTISTFSAGTTGRAGSMNLVQNRVGSELLRIDNLDTGSSVYVRNSDGFVTNFKEYDVATGGSTVGSYYRDANNYTVSGTIWREGKTTTITYYRSGTDNLVLSGLRSVV